ncbi:MAG: SAF domain-containing protein [Chloroflexi bacterium]|nr:SAF domain-containing protein [Chloroflexota bacterium]
MSEFTKRFSRKNMLVGNWVPLVGGIFLASLLALSPGRGLSTTSPGLPQMEPLASVAQQEDGEEGQAAEGEQQAEETPEGQTEDRIVGLVEVVVAAVDIPQGEVLREEILTVVQRPSDNIAVRVGVTVSDPALLVGQITKTRIEKGQAVLSPMVALSATDLASIGSDLSLFVDRGKVAIAFPISRYSGLSYAMRPGDFVDVMMSFNMIELDLEFQTALPNLLARVDEAALEEGQPFLFPTTTSGRLEVIAELGNAVVTITPKGLLQGGVGESETAEQGDTAGASPTAATTGGTELLQRPRRVTQLTVQQVEVLWVGTWDNPDLSVLTPEQQAQGVVSKQRGESQPDVVILSLSVQDALVLKWALEEPGAKLDLVLRSQGDNALYFTTSVSLPQLVEQAGLSIPEPAQFDLQPRIDGSSIPRLPPLSPEDTVPTPVPEGQ